MQPQMFSNGTPPLGQSRLASGHRRPGHGVLGLPRGESPGDQAPRCTWAALRVPPSGRSRGTSTGSSVGRHSGLPDARPRDGRGRGLVRRGPLGWGGRGGCAGGTGVTGRALLEVVEQLPGGHELSDYLVRDLLAPGLVLRDQGLQHVDELLLELAGEHGSAGVVLRGGGGGGEGRLRPPTAGSHRRLGDPSLKLRLPEHGAPSDCRCMAPTRPRLAEGGGRAPQPPCPRSGSQSQAAPPASPASARCCGLSRSLTVKGTRTH